MMKSLKFLFLFIIMSASCTNLFADNGKIVYNVLDYGAVNDGKAYCTQSFQKAIDECATNGGGTIYVPAGQYLIGTIILKSNTCLELAGNATILGSESIEDYNPGKLIYASNASNIAIKGLGKIDGQGKIFWEGLKMNQPRPENLIGFESCNNVHIDDITIVNSPAFNVALFDCNMVHINGIKIINPMRSENTDGIDPISCTNVFISNCYIETGDDAICLKTESADKNCENIVVSNCILISDDSAIKLGTSSKTEIKQCSFSNIIIRNSRYGIALYMKDGGKYEDIQFSNINIETVVNDSTNSNNYPIFMDIEPRNEDTPLGTINNIILSNIIINTYAGNCLIQGSADKSIENLTLNNIRMNVLSRSDLSDRKKPRGYIPQQNAENDFANISSNFTLANIKNLNIEDLVITDINRSDKFQRYAIWGENIENVIVKGLSFEPAIPNINLSNVSFSQCKDVYVSECRSESTRTPFLEIRGAQSTNINLKNNYLHSFSRPTMIHKEVSEKLNINWP